MHSRCQINLDKAEAGGDFVLPMDRWSGPCSSHRRALPGVNVKSATAVSSAGMPHGDKL